ncbi:MAG: hypothetical protein JWQ19_1667 [Subtercola sp.]|nr:hypothetical protein [Subtercola sp.]
MSDNYELPANFYPPQASSTEVSPPTTPAQHFETPAQPSEQTPNEKPSSTAEAAKDQAGQLKDQAVSSGSQVAGAAKDAAGDVVGEAKTQAKDLFQQTQSELKDQAATQQKRVATGLRSLADELGTMASSSEAGGVATDLVQQAASRAGSVATWLDNRDPGSVLHEVRAYAARKPGTFIAIAALAGLAAGRLTKNLASAAADQNAQQTSSDASAASPTQVPLYAQPSAPATPPAETFAPADSEVVYLDDEFGGAPVDGPLYGDRA